MSIVVEVFFRFVVKNFNDEILCFNCFAFFFKLTLVNFQCNFNFLCFALKLFFFYFFELVLQEL